MPVLELQTRSLTPGSGKEPGMQSVQERIAALPAFDIELRAAGLQQLLADITAAPYAGVRRCDVLGAVDAAIESTLPVYQEKMRHSAFPLPAGADALYHSIQALLARAADAWKSVVLKLANEVPEAPQSAQLRTAMLRCVYYLGQQALQAYAVYRAAPESIWKDLHRLYAYAEGRGLDDSSVGEAADTSIGAAYSRVLLLALANPEHLMQGEVYQTWALLDKWATAVRLQRPVDVAPASSVSTTANRFFCDVAGDGQPGFGVEGVSTAPVDPRVIDLEQVLGLVASRMKLLALNHQRSLQLRSEWDLLLRLRSAWEKRPLRSDTRHIERGISVKAVVGLASCHYYYAGSMPFEPEQAEIAIHGGGFSDAPTLSLVPADETPWLESDTQKKLESGFLKPRAYTFDVDNRENDVWKKAHSAVQRVDTELEKNMEQRLLGKIFTFRLVNASKGGVGLQAPADSPVQLRVGELVAAFPHGDECGGDPVLNVIRWIRSAPDRGLLIGLRHIAGDVTPVAVRSLEREAHFQSYARGFVIDQGSGTRSLVVPAALFNYGDRLLVNDGDRLDTLQLSSVLENTRAFSQFSCRAADAAAVSNDDIVSSLKKLLRDNNG
ncbi:MAG: hypothetical protein J5I92_09780 [Thiogranum sp.]|nr:hypothetical protein [Thiogranum sp.]